MSTGHRQRLRCWLHSEPLTQRGNTGCMHGTQTTKASLYVHLLYSLLNLQQQPMFPCPNTSRHTTCIPCPRPTPNHQPERAAAPLARRDKGIHRRLQRLGQSPQGPQQLPQERKSTKPAPRNSHASGRALTQHGIAASRPCAQQKAARAQEPLL